jgi:8-oxo-dGTP pyrophosphatase MutT (NUDIX family)
MYRKAFCSNCNKFGHTNKNCNLPIVSIGMILVQLDNEIKEKISKNIKTSNFIDDINDFNYKRINNIKKIKYYEDKIKFLIIEKKHSLNYIEFIRGLYEVNDIDKLTKMFKLMSNKEINMIREKDFSKLWLKLWNKTAKKKIYQKEYNNSKEKFNELVDNKILDELLTIKSQFDSPEWELPKGRRNLNEKIIDCAIREVQEETSLDNTNYNIINITNNFQDIFIGTNNILYKHIYYLSILNDNCILDKKMIKGNKEVSDLKFVKITDIKKYIRSYNTSKIELFNKIFLFLINICEENNYNNIFLQV